MKPLEEFDILLKHIECGADFEVYLALRNAQIIVEKSLKAFNVIKDKLSVENYGIVGDDPEPEYWLVYNNLMLKKLTREEYYLFKEVLCDIDLE